MEFIENPISNKLQKVEMTIQEIKEAKNELLRLLIVFHNYFKVRIFGLLLLNKAS